GGGPGRGGGPRGRSRPRTSRRGRGERTVGRPVAPRTDGAAGARPSLGRCRPGAPGRGSDGGPARELGHRRAAHLAALQPRRRRRWWPRRPGAGAVGARRLRSRGEPGRVAWAVAPRAPPRGSATEARHRCGVRARALTAVPRARKGSRDPCQLLAVPSTLTCRYGVVHTFVHTVVHSPSRVHPHSCPHPIVDDASRGSTVSLLAEIALTCIDASRIRARGYMPPASDTDCSPWRTISYSCTHRVIHKIAHTVYKRCGRSLSY